VTKAKKTVDRGAKISATCPTDRGGRSGEKALSGPQGSTGTVLIDRRKNKERRRLTDRRVANVPVAVERRKIERRAKVNRRRQIDPTTCERDYTPAEIEFMTALEEYKRTSGRMFPTCSEVLEVLLSLGYRKLPAPSEVHEPPPSTTPPVTPAS